MPPRTLRGATLLIRGFGVRAPGGAPVVSRPHNLTDSEPAFGRLTCRSCVSHLRAEQDDSGHARLPWCTCPPVVRGRNKRCACMDTQGTDTSPRCPTVKRTRELVPAAAKGCLPGVAVIVDDERIPRPQPTPLHRARPPRRRSHHVGQYPAGLSPKTPPCCLPRCGRSTPSPGTWSSQRRCDPASGSSVWAPAVAGWCSTIGMNPH
jgi:hypothetical protein